MNSRIDDRLAYAEVGNILERAVCNRERFIVERGGESAVAILRDFIETLAPAPDWLEKAWQRAKQRGLDKLGPAEIDAEIDAYRSEDSR